MHSPVLLDHNLVKSKIKVTDTIVNDVNADLGQASSTSWWLIHLCECASIGNKYTMMLWPSDLKTGNEMIEADWISESLHAQPLLTVETVVAMISLIEGEVGSHVFLKCWCQLFRIWIYVDSRWMNISAQRFWIGVSIYLGWKSIFISGY